MDTTIIDIKKLSPMMKHYFEIKKNYQDCIIMYRLGDFYEMFFDDALEASKILEITLTGRECGLDERAPMCGIPYHAVDSYLSKLVLAGKKVAICEQLNTPAEAKGMVDRDVIRVISSGTIIEDNILESNCNNYIASIAIEKNDAAVSWCDLSTGEFNVIKCESESSKLLDIISTISPREIICTEETKNYLNRFVINYENLTITKYYDHYFKFANSNKLLCEHYKTQSLSIFDLDDKPILICSAGALIGYLKDTQKRNLVHIKPIKLVQRDSFLLLDTNTRKNLELVSSMRNKGAYGTLLWAIDNTNTSMGARLLRKWIERPLLSEKDINKRLCGIEEILDNSISNRIFETLKPVKDIERLISKLVYNNLNPRDCIAILDTLLIVPDLQILLKNTKSKQLLEIKSGLKTLDRLTIAIQKTISDNPPVTLKDGGFIRRGYNKELDNLLDAKSNSTQWLANLEAFEREKTGIKTLKIGYNKVFGYYIEVSKGQTDKVPFYYIRKQTLTTGERYITPELKEIEDSLLNSASKALEMEMHIYNELLKMISDFIIDLQNLSIALASLDCINSLAMASIKNDYVKPIINAKVKQINIKDGRHPVIDKILPKRGFIPNDTFLDSKYNQILILTGPNMSGKSTYMRQIALITLLAHIGSYVPASYAEITLCDRIFTRIGANDDLQNSQSTFMVEMLEVSNILNNATDKSLLILDEIGRGTSTTDGLSIAWSTLEYISKTIKAKTIFATHYHEICELEERLSGVKNYKVLVDETGDKIVFLHKIARGSASRSFGIEVAEMTGVPNIVIERAREIQKSISEHNKKINYEEIIDENQNHYNVQLDMFTEKNNSQIAAILRDININELSPMQALVCLNDLIKMAKE